MNFNDLIIEEDSTIKDILARLKVLEEFATQIKPMQATIKRMEEWIVKAKILTIL